MYSVCTKYGIDYPHPRKIIVSSYLFYYTMDFIFSCKFGYLQRKILNISHRLSSRFCLTPDTLWFRITQFNCLLVCTPSIYKGTWHCLIWDTIHHLRFISHVKDLGRHFQFTSRLFLLKSFPNCMKIIWAQNLP